MESELVFPWSVRGKKIITKKLLIVTILYSDANNGYRDAMPTPSGGAKGHKKLPTEDDILNNDHNVLRDPGVVFRVRKNGWENFQEREREPTLNERVVRLILMLVSDWGEKIILCPIGGHKNSNALLLFMLIQSPRKKVTPMNILNFESKTCIKYLGVYIDQYLN